MAGTQSRAAFLPADIRLGFGTASLIGPRSRAEAVRLLEAAVDNGIRYFDTARMYGSGEAESVLGVVARRHRDRMIIVSKAGILPERMTFGARAARKLSRMTSVKPPAFARPQFGVFETSLFLASVDQSLKELGCERIDLLLLHEVLPTDITPELLTLLDKLKREGKINGYGLATDPSATRSIVQQFPSLSSVVQIPDSVWERNLPGLQGLGIGVVGSHSIMGNRFSALLAKLRADLDLSRRWNERLEFDPADRAALGSLFMAEALEANPDGIVLFSSGNPANMAANVELAQRGVEAERERIDALRSLVANP